MATTLFLQIMGLSAIAVGLTYLLLSRYHSRVGASSIESKYQQSLDMRLRALREERLDSQTVSHTAEQVRLIPLQGKEPICLALPPPGSPPSFSCG
jgi:hypothetical protein